MFNKSLVKGGAILFIAFGLFNFLNFLYQFAMARFLSVSDYGILATVFALIYIFSIFSESIQTVVAKYATDGKNPGQLRNLLSRSLRKGWSTATKIFLVYLLISVFLAYIFKIHYMLLLLNGIVIYLMFLLPVTRGIAQGRKKFAGLGVNLVLEAGLKILFAVLFVFLGWKVYGAISGVVFGAILAFLFSFIPLRYLYKSKEEKFNAEGIYSYAKPTIFITAVIVFFYSIDIIASKIFFSPEIAGSYAIASILGKIIFWSSVPIVKAMFPLSAESKKDSKANNNVLLTSISIVSLIILGGLILFYFFSDPIITIFSGKEITQSSKILFPLGIAFSFLSLSNLVLLYTLSLGPVKKYTILVLCNLLEVLVLFIIPLLYPGNLELFVGSFVFSSLVLFAGSLMFSKLNRHV
jgi:O-antigen/teichoic acid export membrane protein